MLLICDPCCIVPIERELYPVDRCADCASTQTLFPMQSLQSKPAVLGRVNRSLQVAAGLTVREVRYAGNSSVDSHTHPWAFISFVARGRVIERSERVTEVRGTGAVRLTPAGVPHSNRYGSDGARCLVAEVATDVDHPIGMDVFERPRSYSSGSPVADVARRIYAEFQVIDHLTPLALQGLLSELAVAVLRGAHEHERAFKTVPAWLEHVRDVMHDEPRAVPSLKVLAAESGVHPSHLVRAFRRHYGCAPASYLLRIRIEEARQALAVTNASIAEIALQAGFFDQAHFTRRFRAVTGTTPGRYRASVRP
jgi:AraC family transcriptional regulator